jgi:hypothetical protein
MNGLRSLEEFKTNLLQEAKSILAANLTNKGQSSVNTETLAALVAKVANVNTGKKWASGTKASESGYKLTVTNLAFTPEYIFAWSGTTAESLTDWAFYCKDLGQGTLSFNATGNETCTFWDITIGVGQFSMRVKNYLQSYNWIAFE